MKRFFAACVAIAALSAAVTARAETWDVANDFSITNGNPNGAWSYGYVGDFTNSTFTPSASAYSTAFNGTCPDWVAGGWSSYWEDVPYGEVWKNTTSTIADSVAPGQVGLNPGYCINYGFSGALIVRWTAPTDITVEVTGQFSPAASSSTRQVAVFVDGIGQGQTAYWSQAISGAFDFTLPVTAGETIDFVVYNGTLYGDYGSSPLAATITAVPEPGTLALLAAGLVGLAVCVWQKRK